MDDFSDGAFDTVIACDVLEHVLTVLHGSDLKVKMELLPDVSPRKSVAIGWASRSPAHLRGRLRRAAPASWLPRYVGG
jgi:hypothetical protein